MQSQAEPELPSDGGAQAFGPQPWFHLSRQLVRGSARWRRNPVARASPAGYRLRRVGALRLDSRTATVDLDPQSAKLRPGVGRGGEGQKVAAGKQRGDAAVRLFQP